MENKGISVVICCYNSSARINETLQHLSVQILKSSIAWEIVLVDNASTDNTSAVATETWKSLNSTVPLTIVAEQTPGLSFARRKGVKKANFSIVIFCDDDAWLAENYLQTAFDVMTDDASIGALGGEGIAAAEGQLPEWFDTYKYFFACYPQSDRSGEMRSSNAFLFGAGLVTRKRLVEEIYASNSFLANDRTGDKLSSGGDNELCYLIKIKGYKLWYDDTLKFFHFMPQQRLTLDYLYRLVAGISYSSMRLVLYDYVISGKKVHTFTWLLDFLNRIRFFGVALVRATFGKNNLERRLLVLTAWNGLLAIVHLFGSYQSVYKRIRLIQDESRIGGHTRI